MPDTIARNRPTVDPEFELLESSSTPRTLLEAIANWERLRARNQLIRERFQTMHPEGMLLGPLAPSVR